MFDVHAIKKDFPILARKVHGKPLVYLDSAASAQKPRQVIEAQKRFAEESYANIHRGIHALAEEANAAFEGARAEIAKFLGADDPAEIVFVRNATEAINILSQAWGRANVKKGDRIVVTRMEHHANFVPWQMLAKEREAELVIVGLTQNGQIDLEDFQKKVDARTKILAVTLMSNVLGTINPVRKMADIARTKNQEILVLVDGAQAAARMLINVQELSCDALVFSGHKLYGPSGIGVLWAKRQLLEAMPPFLTGGQMIREVGETNTDWNDIPWKFEAGTPDIIGAVGLGEAIRYLKQFGMDAIAAHEHNLALYALDQSRKLPSLRVLGPTDASLRGGLITFTAEGLHPHDIASLLDEEGIAVRAGHHCTMPLHTSLGISASCRASFGIYTNREEIEIFFNALHKILAKYAI